MHFAIFCKLPAKMTALSAHVKYIRREAGGGLPGLNPRSIGASKNVISPTPPDIVNETELCSEGVLEFDANRNSFWIGMS